MRRAAFCKLSQSMHVVERMPPVRSVAACALLLAATGCSPICRVLVRLLPPRGATLDPAKLTLNVDYVSSGTRSGTETPMRMTPDGDAVETETTIRASSARVSVRAWLDQNGSGTRDSGDLEGASGPFTVVDRGLIRGNDNRLPDLLLTKLP